MAATKAGIPPGWCRARLDAARFSEAISARRSISCRERVAPSRRRELLPFRKSKSSMLTSSGSSIGRLASSVTMAVMSLVSEAIGVTSSAALA